MSPKNKDKKKSGPGSPSKFGERVCYFNPCKLDAKCPYKHNGPNLASLFEGEPSASKKWTKKKPEDPIEDTDGHAHLS